MTDFDALEVIEWNWDKPHRCPRCHTTLYTSARRERARLQCCHCNTFFARDPDAAHRWPVITCEDVPQGWCQHQGQRWVPSAESYWSDYLRYMTAGARETLAWESRVPDAQPDPGTPHWFPRFNSRFDLRDFPEDQPHDLVHLMSGLLADFRDELMVLPSPYYVGADYVLSRWNDDEGFGRISSTHPEVRARLHRAARDAGPLTLWVDGSGERLILR